MFRSREASEHTHIQVWGHFVPWCNVSKNVSGNIEWTGKLSKDLKGLAVAKVLMGNASRDKQVCVWINLYLYLRSNNKLRLDAEVGRMFMILFFNWTSSMSQWCQQDQQSRTFQVKWSCWSRGAGDHKQMTVQVNAQLYVLVNAREEESSWQQE